MSSFLVICGPLMSFGQGATRTSSGFDVSDTVVANFKIFGDLFDQVVFVTWFPSCDLQACSLSNIKALCGPRLKIKLLPVPTFHDFGNRYKQFSSILAGLNSLDGASDSDRIVRFRSDIEYSPLLREILIGYDIFSTFWVSEIQNQLFYSGDFIYVSSVSFLRKYLLSTLRWGSVWFHPSNVSDYTIKYYMPFDWFTRAIALMPFGRYFLLLCLLCFLTLTQSMDIVQIRSLPSGPISRCLWRGTAFYIALPMLFSEASPHLLFSPRPFCLRSIADFFVDYFFLFIHKVVSPYFRSLFVSCRGS